MSNKDRICVAIFHRGSLSIGQANREQYGFAVFHWTILIRPKDLGNVGGSTCYDATDGIRLDPVRRVDENPDNRWWFRTRKPMNPLTTEHFLGAVMIGKLPKDVSVDQMGALLYQISLPERHQDPEQNCVTWIRRAIGVLQNAGYVEQLAVKDVMKAALEFGYEVMRDGPSPSPRERFRNITDRAMQNPRMSVILAEIVLVQWLVEFSPESALSLKFFAVSFDILIKQVVEFRT